MYSIAADAGELFYGLCDSNANPIDAGGIITTVKLIGFSIKRTGSGAVNLTGIVGSGSALTRTATITTVVNTDILDVTFQVSGTSVTFYVRKGQSASWSNVTQSSGLPSNSGFACHVAGGVSNINVAVTINGAYFHGATVARRIL